MHTTKTKTTTTNGPAGLSSHQRTDQFARACRSLERQIEALCNRPAPYTIRARPVPSSEAPSTLAELLEAWHKGTEYAPAGDGSNALALQGTTLAVWDGASDATIWSGPEANYLFRAWHDSHHVLLGAGFDYAGELATARHAVALVSGELERAILWAETWGQFCYHETHGAFPHLQAQFVRDAVSTGLGATVARGLYHREEI